MTQPPSILRLDRRALKVLAHPLRSRLLTALRMHGPATATALLAHRMVQLVVEAKLLPDGALQLVCGPMGELLDHLLQWVLDDPARNDRDALIAEARARLDRKSGS